MTMMMNCTPCGALTMVQTCAKYCPFNSSLPLRINSFELLLSFPLGDKEAETQGVSSVAQVYADGAGYCKQVSLWRWSF